MGRRHRLMEDRTVRRAVRPAGCAAHARPSPRGRHGAHTRTYSLAAPPPPRPSSYCTGSRRSAERPRRSSPGSVRSACEHGHPEMPARFSGQRARHFFVKAYRDPWCLRQRELHAPQPVNRIFGDGNVRPGNQQRRMTGPEQQQDGKPQPGCVGTRPYTIVVAHSPAQGDARCQVTSSATLRASISRHQARPSPQPTQCPRQRQPQWNGQHQPDAGQRHQLGPPCRQHAVSPPRVAFSRRDRHRRPRRSTPPDPI